MIACHFVRPTCCYSKEVSWVVFLVALCKRGNMEQRRREVGTRLLWSCIRTGEESTVNKILVAHQLPLIWEWTLNGHRPVRGSCKAGPERVAATVSTARVAVYAPLEDYPNSGPVAAAPALIQGSPDPTGLARRERGQWLVPRRDKRVHQALETLGEKPVPA